MTTVKVTLPVLAIVKTKLKEMSNDEVEKLFDLVVSEMDKRDIVKKDLSGLDDPTPEELNEFIEFVINKLSKV